MPGRQSPKDQMRGVKPRGCDPYGRRGVVIIESYGGALGGRVPSHDRARVRQRTDVLAVRTRKAAREWLTTTTTSKKLITTR